MMVTLYRIMIGGARQKGNISMNHHLLATIMSKMICAILRLRMLKTNKSAQGAPFIRSTL